jgi:glycosyltransferase involved in cell wall biosynthesis
VHGKIVKPGDMDGFAQVVVAMLKDEELRDSMMRACLERGEKLDFSRLVPQYENMYRTAMTLPRNSWTML